MQTALAAESNTLAVAKMLCAAFHLQGIQANRIPRLRTPHATLYPLAVRGVGLTRSRENTKPFVFICGLK